MKVEHIAGFETAEEPTNVEQPKKRKKQGRKTSNHNKAIAARERLECELNGCSDPRTPLTEVNPDTLTALQELMELPAVDLDSADEVEQRCNDYIKWCSRYHAFPSLASLAVALGVDRVTLIEWGTKSRIGQRHSTIIKRMKTLIAANTVQKGADGSLNPVYAMFLLNNSSQGFANNTRLEVAQTPTEQIDAPKLDDVIEIYDSKDTSDT